MAQQLLTGGDGITGQTGLQSRTAINANFTEIYSRAAWAFDFIPSAEHAAIVAGTSTYDARADLQNLLNVTNAKIAFNRGTYLVNNSLLPRSNCSIEGNGATVRCPNAGWGLVSPTTRGILNFYQVNNIEINNLNVYGTKLAADIDNTPKLGFWQESTHISIHGGIWQNAAYEGLIAGGVMGDVNHITVNGLIMDEVGYPNSFYALPAVQFAGDFISITGCTLKNVGTGIATTGSYWAVTGNTIENPQLVGIGLGDGATGRGCVVVGNTIKLIGHSVSGVNRRGIDINPGSSADIMPVVVGNSILIDGASGDTQVCRGFKLTNMIQAVLGHNVVQIDVRGIGVEVSNTAAGSPTTYTADISGVAVHFLTPLAANYNAGFNVIPGGANNTQNLSLSGCRVTGLGSDTAHYAADINTAGGGTVNRALRDFRKTGGRVRLPGGAIAYDVGDSNIPAVINSGESNTWVEKVQFAAGTTARASFNIPHGVAPTSPAEGDVWGDASGVYHRRGGVTVTVG